MDNPLKKAYEAVAMLKELDLPVSVEQVKAIAIMERQYLREEIIPQLLNEMEPLVNQMHNKFRLEVTYSKEMGLDIQVIDKKPVQKNLFPISSMYTKGKAKFIIRVVYPDGHAFYSKVVWETLADVIRYAGIERVRSLGIMMFGDNFVTRNLNPDERYRISQKEIGDGYYVTTCSTTETKYDQIRKINKDLGLGLRIEKLMQ